MKYKDQYWNLSTKQPYFFNSLKKIGVPDNELEYWDFFEEDENVFVLKIYNKQKEKYEFSVSHYDDNFIGIEFMKELP
jgi:hypothetical protein